MFYLKSAMTTQPKCGLFVSVMELLILLFVSSIVCEANEDYTGHHYHAPLQPMYLSLPPRLVIQPPKILPYRISATVTLPCLAAADPKPFYKWRKNDIELEIDGFHIRQLAGFGTILIDEPGVADEGVYQCFASNSFGVAISVKTILKRSVLEAFLTAKTPPVRGAVLGAPLTLYCNPPHSYPPAVIYWVKNTENVKLQSIETNERISLDYNGNLHFSNIKPDDGLDGLSYVCILQNMDLRTLVQGGDHRISLIQSSKNYSGPAIMWSTPTADTALKGQMKKLKCIFSGFPTPSISWSRLGKSMPPTDRFRVNSFEQELVIYYVELDDGGIYQCTATNIDNSNRIATVTLNITLSVEAAPSWRHDRPPEDVNVAEDDSAQFECRATGIPKPTITWLINGVPVSKLPEKRGRVVAQEYIRYINVTKTDSEVVQCNASNKHGYILANAFLNVLAEPPVFIENPPRVVKVAEGRDVILACEVFGAPKPAVKWRKRGVDSEEGGGAGGGGEDSRPEENSENSFLHVLYSEAGPATSALSPNHRFLQDIHGNLRITNVSLADEGIYDCIASNKFGKDQVSGRLVVRRRTRAVVKPANMLLINVTNDVKISCDATTDPAERHRLKIDWTKDGHVINYGARLDVDVTEIRDGGAAEVRGGGVSRQPHDNTLKISLASVADTGAYRCNASNGLDWYTDDVLIVVRDVPDPPYNVTLTNCTADSAEVTWLTGSENNDPIREFVVYYNTSHEPLIFQEAVRAVDITINRAIIELRPWTNYTFHVRAVNSLGMSARMSMTSPVCTTAAAKPSRNPRSVCTRSGDPGTLIITWEPMTPPEQNGDGFHYLVMYRPRSTDVTISGNVINVDNDATLDAYPGDEGELDDGDTEAGGERVEKGEGMSWREVNNWWQSELIVHVSDVYGEYDLIVQAVNSEGPAPWTSDQLRIGFSSQNSPVVNPQGFSVQAGSLTSTGAEFYWQAVDDSVDVIRGFFIGYEVVFWRTSEPLIRRTEPVIRRSWDPCPVWTPPMTPLTLGVTGPVNISLPGSDRVIRARTNQLWSYASITAAVRVINGGLYEGNLSNYATFTTPQGVPGAVSLFKVVETGSHHVSLAWDVPFEPNGVLIGYEIKYAKESPLSSQSISVPVPSPTRTQQKLLDLEPNTRYLVHISAQTEMGSGVETHLQYRTHNISEPCSPVLDQIDVGEDFFNVSWFSMNNTTHCHNPGSRFYLEYRQTGSDATTSRPSVSNTIEESLEWVKTKNMAEDNWIKVDRLLPGSWYTVRIVAMSDGKGKHITRSIENVVKLPESEASIVMSIAISGWFVGVLCAIVFLVLVLVIICVIKRPCAKKYSVYEKELQRSHDTNDSGYHDPRFGEYASAKNGTAAKRLPALTGLMAADSYEWEGGSEREGDEVWGEETDDSLAEYGSVHGLHNSRFREDGSFIGRYVSREQQERRGRPTPPSLQDFRDLSDEMVNPAAGRQDVVSSQLSDDFSDCSDNRNVMTV